MGKKNGTKEKDKDKEKKTLSKGRQKENQSQHCQGSWVLTKGRKEKKEMETNENTCMKVQFWPG